MSLASLFMEDLDRTRERTSAEMRPKAKWSARRTAAFVILASLALWGVILAVVMHLL